MRVNWRKPGSAYLGFLLTSGGLFYKMTAETKGKMAKAYPLRRLGKAEDVASTVVFLASDAANWITGQAISVDSGYFMA